MTNTTKCGPWIRRFLLEHLVHERNLARNTQRSYRDTLALLMPFIAGRANKPIDQLDVDHVSAEGVRAFLQHLEQARRCSLTTRNQRLAVIHALARFIGERSPEHIEWSGQIEGREKPNALALRPTGWPSARTRRTISYLTWMRSRLSKKSHEPKSGSATRSG